MKLPEPIAEFNRAVEWADRLLDFRHDRLEPLALHAELIAAGMPGAARQLWRAGKPLGYFRAKEHFPVDRKATGMVKTKTAVRKQQRKAKNETDKRQYSHEKPKEKFWASQIS